MASSQTSEKKGYCIAAVKNNQSLRHARIKVRPGRPIPSGSSTRDAGCRRGPGRSRRGQQPAGPIENTSHRMPGGLECRKLSCGSPGGSGRERPHQNTAVIDALARGVRNHPAYHAQRSFGHEMCSDASGRLRWGTACRRGGQQLLLAYYPLTVASAPLSVPDMPGIERLIVVRGGGAEPLVEHGTQHAKPISQ